MKKTILTLFVTMLMITTVFGSTIVSAEDPTCSASWQEDSPVEEDTIIHADFTWADAFLCPHAQMYAVMSIWDPSGGQRDYYVADDTPQEPSGSRTLEVTADETGSWMAKICVYTGIDEYITDIAYLEVESNNPTYYTLTVNTDGSGTVSLNPSGGTYESGTVVTLTANPDSGWSFDHWSGDVDDPNSASTSVVMDSDKTVTAHFIEDGPTYYTLTVNTDGSGTVSLNPSGGTYESGTVVTLTANPSDGWSFSHWSGDVDDPNSASTSVVMDSDKTVTVYFVEDDQPQRDYYGLMIGVGDYNGDGDTDDEGELPCPKNDAIDMKDALSSGTNWERTNIKVLTDATATVSNIQNKLNWLTSKEGENDISVIYFAGHGAQIDDNNGDENDGLDECLVLYNGIWRDDEFKDILDNSFDGKVVVILDCCHSGGMMPCSVDGDISIEDWGQGFLTNIAGQDRIILMACGEEETTMGLTLGEYDYGLNHGMFTLGILSGLHGSADDNGDQTITAEECYDHAKQMFESTQQILFHKINSTATIDPDPPGELGDIQLVTGITNNPPKKPDTPSGPTDIKADIEYEYESSVNDPDGDKMNVFFYWDDGNFSIFQGCNSGENLRTSHKWEQKFQYNIRVIAIDEHGAVSDWSDPLNVGKSKNKQTINPLFLNFFEKLMEYFPILRQLLHKLPAFQ